MKNYFWSVCILFVRVCLHSRADHVWLLRLRKTSSRRISWAQDTSWPCEVAVYWTRSHGWRLFAGILLLNCELHFQCLQNSVQADRFISSNRREDNVMLVFCRAVYRTKRQYTLPTVRFEGKRVSGHPVITCRDDVTTLLPEQWSLPRDWTWSNWRH
jgi:hypothetical protein